MSACPSLGAGSSGRQVAHSSFLVMAFTDTAASIVPGRRLASHRPLHLIEKVKIAPDPPSYGLEEAGGELLPRHVELILGEAVNGPQHTSRVSRAHVSGFGRGVF